MRRTASNQRDYFRVDCQVLISQRTLDALPPPDIPADRHFPDSEHFGMLRELRRLDHESIHLLHAIGEKDRNVEAYLGHLNRKLDLLARHLASLMPDASSGSRQNVSLSEGGVLFHMDVPATPGSVLAIRLTLLPSWIGLTLYASVVANNDDERNVSVRFENLSDADRQVLARHVMQVQMSQQRRNRIETGEPDDDQDGEDHRS